MPANKLKKILFLCISFFLLIAPASLAQDGTRYRALTEWEYHWGDLPRDDGPNIWKSAVTLTPGKIPRGVTTIWFKIKLPEKRWTNPAIYYQLIYAKSLDIYLDRQKIITKKHRTFCNTNIFVSPLNPNFSGKTLSIRINQPELRGPFLGRVPKVFIGDFDYLWQQFLNENYSNLIFGCFFILLAMALLLSSLFFKSALKKSWVALGFILFFFGVNWAIFPKNIGTYFPELEEYLLFLVIITVSAIPVLLVYFFEQIFGPGQRFLIRRLWQIQLVFSSFCIGTSTVNILSQYRFNEFDNFVSHYFMGFLYVVLLILSVSIAIYNIHKGNIDAKIYTAGFSVFAVLLIVDLIISLFQDSSYQLYKYGELVLLISLICILGRRIAINYKQVIEYSQELEIKNRELNFIRKEVEKSRDQLIDLNKTLEQRVLERTGQLNKANEDLTLVNEELSASNENLVSTLDMLTKTQNQLIESEKMAALGQLVAGVAHEINSPLGAIGASIENMMELLNNTLLKLAPFYQTLSREDVTKLNNLLAAALQSKNEYVTSSEERKYRKAWLAHFRTKDIPEPGIYADMLVTMGFYDIEPQASLFENRENIRILEIAYKLSELFRNAKNIKLAVERTTKVIFALKSYAHFESTHTLVEADIRKGIETVLTLYQNKIKHGVEVIQNYADIKPLRCYPDELNQIWTNLIHNALQAMDYHGKLSIDSSLVGNEVIVAITDTGIGIPESIQTKIFDPFFTTKPQGEGSGLGLHIVKQIVEKHKGKIEVESYPGHTSFRVFIPTDL